MFTFIGSKNSIDDSIKPTIRYSQNAMINLLGSGSRINSSNNRSSGEINNFTP